MGVFYGAVVPELQDLIVVQPPLLSGVGHVGRRIIRWAVDARVLSPFLCQDKALALCVDAEHKFVARNPVVEVPLHDGVDVKAILGVTLEALLPFSIERCINAGVVVPVNVLPNLLYLICSLGLVWLLTPSYGQQKTRSVQVKSFTHFLHEESKVFLVIWSCLLQCEHVVGRKLPVNIQTIKTSEACETR